MLWNAGIKAEMAFLICAGKVKVVVPSAFSVSHENNSPLKMTRSQPSKDTTSRKRGSVPVALTPRQFEQLHAPRAKDMDHHERAKRESQVARA